LTEERKTGSDIHELLFVQELNKKHSALDAKQAQDQSIAPGPTSSESAEFLCSSTSQQDDGLMVDPADEGNEEEEVLTMGLVRFASLPILPSQIDFCSLEYQERQRKR
jgi:hypothetical protein